jgi:hypothetical protein
LIDQPINLFTRKSRHRLHLTPTLAHAIGRSYQCFQARRSSDAPFWHMPSMVRHGKSYNQGTRERPPLR